MCCSPRRYIIRTSNIIGDSDAELLREYDRAVRQRLGYKADDTDEFIQYSLKRAVGSIFILVGGRAMKKEILDELRAKYPSFIFVLLSGEEFPVANELGLENLELIKRIPCLAQ